jgi:hypothetical protein
VAVRLKLPHSVTLRQNGAHESGETVEGVQKYLPRIIVSTAPCGFLPRLVRLCSTPYSGSIKIQLRHQGSCTRLLPPETIVFEHKRDISRYSAWSSNELLFPTIFCVC